MKYRYIITARIAHPTVVMTNDQMEYAKACILSYDEDGKFATNKKSLKLISIEPTEIKMELLSTQFIAETQASRSLRLFTEALLDENNINNFRNLIHRKRLLKYSCELKTNVSEEQQPKKPKQPKQQSTITLDDLTAQQAHNILIKLLEIDWGVISYAEVCGMTTAAKLNLLFSVLMTGSVQKFIAEEERSFWDFE